MDPMFFQLDHVSLTYWRPVIDHLMTHDKMTFRDLMGEWFVACDFFLIRFVDMRICRLLTLRSSSVADAVNVESLHVEGSRVRASGAASQAPSLRHLLQRNGSVSAIHSRHPRSVDVSLFRSSFPQTSFHIPESVFFSERLSECLRLQIPLIQSQVFLCFRVLLLRLSCYHITSLWPVIITELVISLVLDDIALQLRSAADRIHSVAESF